MIRMSVAVLCALSALLVVPAASRTGPFVRLVKAISLPGVAGRIDHMSIDLKTKRVFIAALGNNSVEIVDLSTNKAVHSVRALNQPQGIVFLPGLNTFVVASGGDGACTFFDAESFRPVGVVPLGDDADNIRYDATRQRLYVGCGNGALAIVDPVSRKKLGDIPLSGHPESFQLDDGMSRIFVNVPATNRIELINPLTQESTGNFGMKHDHENFPMADDQAHHRLLIGCRDPANLLILNSDSGTVKARIRIHGDCDDIFYNDRTKLIFISCGEGFLDIVKLATPDQYPVRLSVPTALGARTSLLIPELRLFLLAVPRRGEQPASIRVYEVE